MRLAYRRVSREILLRYLFCALMLVAVILATQYSRSNIRVYADQTDVATYSEEVRSEMASSFSEERYTTSGGGYYRYSDLLTNEDPNHPNVWVINESTYSQLTSAAQTDFVSDLNKASSAVVSGSADGTYTNESKTSWFQILQQQEGVGTKFMNVILEGTQPDFVTAQRIYEPFSPVISSILGVMAVFVMALVAISMASDIFYIAVPPIRLLVAEHENDGRGKIARSFIFTFDAIYAVKTAENDSGNGTPKHAIGIYLKRRIVMLPLLGICMMYLVQGQIYTFVGWILDLVSGFLGF